MRKNSKGAMVFIALAAMLAVTALAALPAADAADTGVPGGEVPELFTPDGGEAAVDPEENERNYDVLLWIIGIAVTSFGAVLMFKPGWIRLD